MKALTLAVVLAIAAITSTQAAPVSVSRSAMSAAVMTIAADAIPVASNDRRNGQISRRDMMKHCRYTSGSGPLWKCKCPYPFNSWGWNKYCRSR